LERTSAEASKLAPPSAAHPQPVISRHIYLGKAVLIKEYEASWPERFDKISAVVGSALHGVAHRIEHVGSTSVSGLAAKPIIDIDIVYMKPCDFLEIGRRLYKLGYMHNGNQGILDREAFKRIESRRRHRILDKIRHHLYVCPAESAALNRHLLFRDYLRENAWARREYYALKKDIAVRANQDQKAYASMKEVEAKDFVLRIIELAESAIETKLNDRAK
jgi:GrpB-like predicted nucleotidyltransferase (UPF0157 family)